MRADRTQAQGVAVVLGLALQQDRRISARYSVLIEARIVSANFWCPIPCEIVNRSDGGCKLRLVSNVPLPARFDIEIPSENVTIPVRLVWSRDKTAGVSFPAASWPASPPT